VEKAVAEANKDDMQRWTTERKAALILSVLKGETSIQEAARRHGVTVAELERWKERFLLGAENALRARPKDEEALCEEQIKS
jgi:transposase-like protein